MNTAFKRHGANLIYLSLGLIFFWFGGIKFTDGGANAIQGLVNNSPILSWVYGVFSVETFAAVLGTVEIIIGISLIAGVAKPRLGQLGGWAGIITFLVTLSFMLTTPGVVPEGASFPVLSGMPGEFLLKDLVLLAASIFIAGDAAHRAAEGT